MDKKSDNHLSWPNFENTYLNQEAPAVIPIAESPEINLFTDPNSFLIGMEIELDEGVEVEKSILREIEIHKRNKGSNYYLVISTSHSTLFQSFYFMLLNVSDLIQDQNISPPDAVHKCISDFMSLLQTAICLSENDQIGLWGELWLLKRLIEAHGNESLQSWTGHLKESHDFRIRDKEFEVKTTRKKHRDHIINGLDQMQPSPDHSLFLVSIQLEPAGMDAGCTLPEMISDLRQSLANSPDQLSQFNNILSDKHHYFDEHENLYPSRWQLRTKVSLIPVDNKFPALVKTGILGLLGNERASKIDHVTYQVRLDGMGEEDGSPYFLDMFPQRHNDD